ncbi:MAG TPA: adenosylcobinamide-GDP ribazoletransferase [Halomicronema sp.]
MAEIDRAVGIVVKFFNRQFNIFAAAIAFYTCLPLPQAVTLEFRGIARFAPLIGVLLGGILGFLDAGLQQLGMPLLTRSALVVVAWIAITGGLHLDGVMDSADGLAVLDPQKRLKVMADSLTGAYGAMAAIALLLLKTVALHDLGSSRVLALMAAAGWGRWGQLVAITRYAYLKPTGKGAFHKDGTGAWDLLPGLVILLVLSGVQIFFYKSQWLVGVGMALGGGAIAILTGAWFNYKLGGHTGDTYGAVVEWTEALLLCLLVGL